MKEHEIDAAVERGRRRLHRLIQEREERLERERSDATAPRSEINREPHYETYVTPSDSSVIHLPAVYARRPKRSGNRRLYFAYGSNLSQQQMASRCPGSSLLYAHNLYGFRLVFQRVASIQHSTPGDYVPGAIYLIEPEDEKDLDRFEGVSSGVYEKQTFRFFTPRGNWRDVLFYVKITGEELSMPTKSYLEKIVSGYNKLGLDKIKLKDALSEAYTASTGEVT